MRRLAILGVLLAVLALGAAPARANRAVLSRGLLQVQPEPPKPPQGQIEGACGLAVHSNTLYVADYYQRAVDAFSLAGEYLSQILLPGGPIAGEGSNALDGVCGLASVPGPGGVLYGNEWHQGVVRLKPTAMVFDTGESTGVAVDEAGRVYADDRAYVAVYEASGEAVEAGGEPLRIGQGSLGDAYGLAVSPDGSQVYVPDAATGTVKVFEPGDRPDDAGGGNRPARRVRLAPRRGGGGRPGERRRGRGRRRGTRPRTPGRGAV